MAESGNEWIVLILQDFEFGCLLPDLEEDHEAGNPEASQQGVVDQIEHSNLQPREGRSGSSSCICVFTSIKNNLIS